MKKVIIALLVLGVCGTAAFAGEWKKDAGVGLGIAMPMGDTADVLKSGIGFGLDYDGWKINDMFSIGGGFFYTSGDIKIATAYSVKTWGLTPFARYSKEVDLGGKKATAYGLFGMGFYNSSTDVPGVTNETDMGFNLGGGIMYPLADKMNLGFDLKYHNIMTEGDSTTYLVPSVKFTYSF